MRNVVLKYGLVFAAVLMSGGVLMDCAKKCAPKKNSQNKSK